MESTAAKLSPAIQPAVSQYLTFTLGSEEYGVDILRVQEIRGWQTVTRVPNTPNFLLGVLNLRGTIVPIIDMRMRFALDKVEYTSITVIVVLSVISDHGSHVFGVVVDSVSDVLDVKNDDVRPTPEMGCTVNTEFIKGLATIGDQMVTLLDIDKLLTHMDLTAVVTAQGAAA